MLLPDKHVALSESVLGLGAIILSWVRARPLSLDAIHERAKKAANSSELPTYHGFDSIMLALLFLYSIGTIELTGAGKVRRCVS